jgi:hypothetical protein
VNYIQDEKMYLYLDASENDDPFTPSTSDPFTPSTSAPSTSAALLDSSSTPRQSRKRKSLSMSDKLAEKTAENERQQKEIDRLKKEKDEALAEAKRRKKKRTKDTEKRQGTEGL